MGDRCENRAHLSLFHIEYDRLLVTTFKMTLGYGRLL
jgi:hypothetical protein